MTLVEGATRLFMEKYTQLLQQREEIVIAFIAKYGCQPDEICQVEWRKSPTETVWWVKLRDDKLESSQEGKPNDKAEDSQIRNSRVCTDANGQLHGIDCYATAAKFLASKAASQSHFDRDSATQNIRLECQKQAQQKSSDIFQCFSTVCQFPECHDNGKCNRK